MSGEEAVVGSLSGLLGGGLVKVEVVEDASTGDRLLCLTVEMECGSTAEVTVQPDEAVDIATDLLMFAQQCREEGGSQ